MTAKLPEHWQELKAEDGRSYYYYHRTGQTQWDHPLDDYYRNLYAKLKKEKLDRQRAAAAAAAAAVVSQEQRALRRASARAEAASAAAAAGAGRIVQPAPLLPGTAGASVLDAVAAAAAGARKGGSVAVRGEAVGPQVPRMSAQAPAH
jgi:hypothetical protein